MSLSQLKILYNEKKLFEKMSKEVLRVSSISPLDVLVWSKELVKAIDGMLFVKLFLFIQSCC